MKARGNRGEVRVRHEPAEDEDGEVDEGEDHCAEVLSFKGRGTSKLGLVRVVNSRGRLCRDHSGAVRLLACCCNIALATTVSGCAGYGRASPAVGLDQGLGFVVFLWEGVWSRSCLTMRVL